MVSGSPGSSPICAVLGCTSSNHARGWCSKHYQRWKKYGDPEYTHNETDLRKRVERVGYTVSDKGCHIWLGDISKQGYACISVAYEKYRVHRVVLAWRLGRDLQSDEVACHTCDVRACINPEHLFVGSQADNMRDMVSKGRHGTSVKMALAKASTQELLEELARRSE